MDHITTVESCRICHQSNFETVINLGDQYIANAFYRKENPPEIRAPLHLMRCINCGLVQLAHSINCDMMYRNYWYKSSINHTMREHLQLLVKSVLEIKPLRSGDTVIDVGCNDQFMLGCYPKDANRVGVDPSNVAKLAPLNCNMLVNDYFSAKALKDIPKAKIITSIAMFYDLNDPKSFVQDVRKCLADDGIWVLELAYLPLILSQNCYDTICHEHVCYYSLTTFELTLVGTDLEVFKIEKNNTNGGSFRLYVAPKGSHNIGPEVQLVRNNEKELEFDKPYREFAQRITASKNQLISFLKEQKRLGKKVYGYGASTKGQVTMQYCEITSDLIVAVAERNPDKYGLYTPGTNARICSEEEMRKARPDFLVIFPWHFLEEFVVRERTLLMDGTRFVVPLPKFDVIYWQHSG